MAKQLLFIFVALLPMVVNAYDSNIIEITYDAYIGGIYYNFSGDEAVVASTKSSSYSGAIVIPESVTYSGKTYCVTSIGDYAFSERSRLTYVYIPNSVTSIGNYAFHNCSGLTSITIPESVTSIGERAFDGTPWLNNRPDGLVYAGKVAYKYKGEMPSGTHIAIDESTIGIAGGAFSGSSGLTSITIPKSVTNIGNSAFQNCSSLTSVTIPESVTSIGESAFSSCSGLTSVTIPKSVTSIGSAAFRNCYGLTSVTIPESVTSIGIYAFEECISLTSVTISGSVTSIDYGAFYGCSGLTSVHIKDLASWCNISFEDHYSNPLYYAKHLYIDNQEIKELVIPEGVTNIGDNAFYGCSGMTTITIPNSMTSIGTEAFGGCSGLASIQVKSDNTFFDSRDNCNAIIETATKTLIQGCQNTTIPKSVTSIGSSAFSGCFGLTSITIPKSVKSIGDGAFYGCSGLTAITIPESVTSIGDGAFEGCSGLTSVIIPNSVTSIGYHAFYNTPWFNNQPDGLVYAGKVAYVYKGKMPSGTGITIEKGTVGIADYAFSSYDLTSVIIPNSVTSIGYHAFGYCSRLTSITIPESVTYIGGAAFTGCSRLTSITIPEGVTSIEPFTFSYCTNLESITIPYSVTSIGDYAFHNCGKLWTIICPAVTTPIVAPAAFDGVTTSGVRVYVPATALSVYQTTSPWKDFRIMHMTDDQEDRIDAVYGEEGVKQAPIYDLSGRCIDTLRRGINIVGGKMVWVR